MKRILKVKENLSNFDKTKTINLCVVNEYGEDLQGKIIVDKIDKVEYESLVAPKECEDIPEYAQLYFVYNPAHEGKPQKKYTSYEEAKKDAESIASKYDQCNVYVLQIIAEIEKKKFVHKTVKECGKVTEKNNWESIPF